MDTRRQEKVSLSNLGSITRTHSTSRLKLLVFDLSNVIISYLSCSRHPNLDAKVSEEWSALKGQSNWFVQSRDAFEPI